MATKIKPEAKQFDVGFGIGFSVEQTKTKKPSSHLLVIDGGTADKKQPKNKKEGE